MAIGGLSRPSVTLSINWKITLLGLIILPLLVRLGFWQLERAEQKQQLLDSINQLQSMPVTSLSVVIKSGVGIQYRKVSTKGLFLPGRYWLVDNKVHHGKVGYEVIAPFIFDSNQIILVSRGWVAAPQLRSDLPEISFPSGQIELQGRLITPSVNKMVGESEPDQGWPRRIQEIQIEQAGKQLETELLPWVLQASPDSPYALDMEWRDVNVSPAKHHGYALQWFAMSLALLIALIVVNIKFKHTAENVIHKN